MRFLQIQGQQEWMLRYTQPPTHRSHPEPVAQTQLVGLRPYTNTTASWQTQINPLLNAGLCKNSLLPSLALELPDWDI